MFFVVPAKCILNEDVLLEISVVSTQIQQKHLILFMYVNLSLRYWFTKNLPVIIFLSNAFKHSHNHKGLANYSVLTISLCRYWQSISEYSFAFTQTSLAEPE